MTAGEPQAGEPRWLREAFVLWWTETRLFFSTLARLATRPRRFGAEWADGSTRAMNPLGFLLASWPLLLPIDYGLQRLLGWDRRPNVSFMIEAARAMRPYLFVIPMALLLYGFFRAAESTRKLTTTVGILLYWSVLGILGWIAGLLVCFVAPVGSTVPKLTSLCTMAWGALALAGAHRVHWAWCLGGMLGCGAASLMSVNDLLEWLHWS
jgi:hypothetical protein